MSKNLIYYVVGGEKEYSEMLRTSIDSVRKSNEEKYDILIITSFQYYWNNLQFYSDENTFYHFINDETPNSVFFNKLRIFDYSKIDEYDKILFLDADTIVNVNLEVYFNSIERNKLNIVVEDYSFENHNRIQFSLNDYTEEDVKFFEKNKIHTFNSGTFLFENSILMKRHFSNVLRLIDEHQDGHFMDQSFFNSYFNKYAITSDVLFKPKENYIYLINENIFDEMDYSNKIFHFIEEPGNPGTKLEKMNYIFNNIFNMTDYKLREDLIKDLKNIISGTKGVEIGVFKGDFSKYILQNWDGTLYMVDVWRPLGDEYEDASNHGMYSNILQDAVENIKGMEDRGIMIRAKSKIASEIFEDESLDFIYIDGNHAYEYVLEDLNVWFPKLKKGGVFSGHDYINMDWYNDPNFCPNGKDKYIWSFNTDGSPYYNGIFGVNPAVDEFSLQHGYTPKITSEWFGTWWFIK